MTCKYGTGSRFIAHKMGIRGSATCSMNFGDNGECYAELLGEERQGMKIMFQLMNEARIGVAAFLAGRSRVGKAHEACRFE